MLLMDMLPAHLPGGGREAQRVYNLVLMQRDSVACCFQPIPVADRFAILPDKNVTFTPKTGQKARFSGRCPVAPGPPRIDFPYRAPAR